LRGRHGIKVKISTFRALFGIDRITLTLSGREDRGMAEFEGTQVPGVASTAVPSRISD
jgi:hypothetical protein